MDKSGYVKVFYWQMIKGVLRYLDKNKFKKNEEDRIMCEMKRLFLPDTIYRGVIIRLQNGHIFYPYKVKRLPNGMLAPVATDHKCPALQDKKEFLDFCHKFQTAIECSSDPDPGVYIEEISGNNEFIRDRILLLNKRHGLPGIIQARQQVAA